MKKDKDTVRSMFDSIAPKYDFLNHVLSMGIDKIWRKKVAKMVCRLDANSVLDAATGTGDLAITISKYLPNAKITAVDMSRSMLEVAQTKLHNKSLENRISLRVEDATEMSFEDNIFDAVTIAFGVRNFENLDKGLIELRRVLKSGATLIIMEVSTPNGFIAKPYMFYFGKVLPAVGRMVSDNPYAYSYLFNSVVNFPCGEQFVEIMSRCGFKDVKYRKLTHGVATIYWGIK